MAKRIFNMGTIKEKIPYFILELFLVVTAVFLGLVVNEIRLSYNNNLRTTKVLEYIVAELEINSNQIKSILPYHKLMYENMQQLNQRIFTETKPRLTYNDLLAAMPKGFRVPLLESTGWQLLNNTGSMDNLELSLAVELSKIYKLQSFLNEKIERVSDNMYIAGNNNIHETENLVVSFSFLVSDILLQEERLFNLYPKIINAIKKNNTE